MNKAALEQSIWFSPTASKELSSLKPVFEKLRLLHDRYIQSPLWRGDCAYWYDERPHVGLLAAAVCLNGGIALGEYAAKKPKGRGRADLYFSVDNVSFGCEAKRSYLSLKKSAEESAQKAFGILKKEYRDAKSREKTDCKTNKILGLCFLIPRSTSALPDLSELMKALKNNSNCAALVWIGVSNDQESRRKKKTYYPGFFLAIRES
jgi:hypothetical protein